MRRRVGEPPGPYLIGRAVVRLRFVVVVGWLAAAVLALVSLPRLDEAQGDALGSLVPEDAPAYRAQLRSAELFRFPVLSNTMVVQHDPNGLSRAAQTRVVERSLALARREYPDLLSVPFALPLTNTRGVVPGSRQSGTTAITYLYFEPGLGLQARDRLARWFADPERPFRAWRDADGVVGVTGVVPARVEQGRLIREAIPFVEAATVLLILVVIGLTYRAVTAPLLTLLAVAVSFVVSLGLLAAAGRRFGIAVPGELEPIVLVLLLGVVTDYSIFYLSRMRHRLEQGESRLEAAERTAGQVTPIVLTAGLIVAAGTASLLAAQLEFFRVFGPGLAFAVLVGLAVSVTFVPAALATLGGAAFWPRRPAPDLLAPARGRVPLVARMAGSRALAGLVVVLAVIGLLLAARPVRGLELGVEPIGSLPAGSEPVRAAEAAAEGFAPGVLSPTLLLVEQAGLGGLREELLRFQRLLEAEPGVAGVIGPGTLPASVPRGVAVSETGAAARFVVLAESDPLGPQARAALDDLRRRVPLLLERAGLAPTTVAFAGNTALADETIATVLEDLGRIALAALVVNVLFLVVFLRSLLAPLYLLATSVLALAAALGLTALVFQDALGRDQLAYYVPFMAAVLLVSLGSDYNVFLVGRIWQETGRRPFREAIAVAVPAAARAINVAGLALALSFGLLALVPLDSFRQFAFAMLVGVFVEAFLVRTWLVPALLTLAGRWSAWPGRLLVLRRRPAGR
ncbi:MAG TPA: MMPL family transporter [Gaiellaceae bacterium]|nr:MMPL family transporter [Gaiellaceae bacterium]